MATITDQVQKLIEQGETETALETLASWLRSQQTSTLNEVILLRSRYEQVQRELGLNLISPEEAARSYSQINFALLNLLQNIEKPLPNLIQTSNRQRWLLAGVGFLIFLVVCIIAIRILLPDKIRSNPPTNVMNSEQTSSSDAESPKGLPIQFPQGQKASLFVVDTKVTYSVLEGKVEPYNAENQKIILKIRALLHEGRGGMNFWDSNFRVLVNDLPYAGQGGLNEIVENDSFKDGEVFFIIPRNTNKADLKLTFYKENAILPLTW